MKVAILGLGVVGRGVYDILANDFKDITVKYIFDKDDNKTKDVKHLLAESYEQIINDREVEVVIELIGGKNVAYDFIVKAIKNHKNVVTANKALISERFKELNELAKKYNVKLLYEASVAGAVILIDPLKKIREINQINKIEGILNGSTNYILSKVFLEGVELKEAISNAYKLGYLETGSDDDMNGLDSLRKVNILSMLSYKTFLKEEDILRISLLSLNEKFINYVKDKGCFIKYIAQSEVRNNRLSIKVEPLVIGSQSIFANINYEENIVNIFGKYHLKQSFVGQGAGRYPTASAVIYDLLTIKSITNECFEFNKIYQVNNNDERYHFLIQTFDKIYKSKLMTYGELQRNKDIIFFSRIEEGLYEKL
ncbi:MAG: homoserine dehydrogenase [Bacilli bacterium]